MMSIKNSMMSKRVPIKSVQLSQSNDKLINRIIDHQVKGVAKELLDWRNDLGIDAARDKCQDLTVDRYSIICNYGNRGSRRHPGSHKGGISTDHRYRDSAYPTENVGRLSRH